MVQVVNNSTQLAAALVAAALPGGDAVIQLKAGTYANVVTISSGVRLYADAADTAAIKITGSWTINSTASVVIDGLKFVDASSASDTGLYNALKIVSTANVHHVVENSVFLRDAAPVGAGETPANKPLHYAIYVEGPAAGATVAIQDNHFTSTNVTDVYGPGNWYSAVWTTGTNVGTLTVDGNEFQHLRSAINAGSFNANFHITDNHFADVATAIAFGGATVGEITTVTGNVFGSGIDSELNFRTATAGGGLQDVAQFTGADGFYALGGPGVNTLGYAGHITSLTPFVRGDGDGSGWKIVGDHGSGEVVNFEQMNDVGAGKILLVGSGGYPTILAALNAAAAGDTIVVAAGTYADAVTIAAGVTIQRAAGVSIDDVKITGAWTINSATSVVIDGLKFVDTSPVTDNSQYNALSIVGTANVHHVVENSVFLRDAAPAAPGGTPVNNPLHYAISVDGTGVGSTVTIQDNHFASTNLTNVYGPGNWRSGVWTTSTPNAGVLTIDGNDFQHLRSAVNAGSFNDHFHVTNNHFADLATAMAFGGATVGVITTVTGNIFGERIDSEINFTTATGSDFEAVGQFNDTGGFYALGGPGVNTVGYAGHITGLTAFARSDGDGSGWKITGDHGAGEVVNVEQLNDVNPGKILLVGSGGYATIQAAINAASAGDTIRIAAGTYNENVTVNKAGLNLIGDGDATVIQGTFRADNAINGATSAFFQTAPGYSGATGDGVTIKADHVTLKDLKVSGFVTGVELFDDNGTVLNNVTISDGVNGIRKGTTADVANLVMLGGKISQVYIGVNFAKSADDDQGDATGVTINGTTFSAITQKGIYVEALANSVIRGVTMTDVGVYGGGLLFGAQGKNGNGIDINLKYDAYQNITIESFTFTNVGLSNGLGASDANAAAISIKARDDGPNYSHDPASFSGALIVRNGVINGTSTGVRVGEDGKIVAGPQVAVTDVRVTGAIESGDHGAFINDTASTMSVVFTGPSFHFHEGVDTGVVVFNPYNPPAEPDPDPVTPPPPQPGQGAGGTPEVIVETGFNAVTGVDPTSDKATKPTIVLPDGREVPNQVYQEAQQLTALTAQLKAGVITEDKVIDKLVEFALDTTSVALQAYQFFTGATPTEEGVKYLVNSDDNPNDLTDPYYAVFNPDNRYINFAINLGAHGEGQAKFAQDYGSLSFEQAARQAYDKIIGFDHAKAAGIDVDAAIKYVMAQTAYFQALGGDDVGAKAAMVGFLMYAGSQAKVGTYYDATRSFLTDVFHGEADYHVDLTGGAGHSGTSMIADMLAA